MRRCLLCAFVVLTTAACGFAQPAPDASASESQLAPTPRASLLPTDGSKTDGATDLPTRVIHNPSGVTLVLIPVGEFQMGSPETEPGRSKGDKERRHRRVISKPFYLGETEVTIGQFRAFVRASGYKTDAERGTPDNNNVAPGSFASTPGGDRTWDARASWSDPFPILKKEFPTREDHPVVHVSWNDATRFGDHFGLRLPTEAEWEYAARAGSTARFPWGKSEEGGKGFANVADESRRKRFPNTNVIFPFDDGVVFLSPVRRYKPNAWGLYDMIGNVEEWCQDAYGMYPRDGSDESAGKGDPGPNAGARMLRGGSWLGNSGHTRSAARIGMGQTSRRDFQGFRVAADVEGVRTK